MTVTAGVAAIKGTYAGSCELSDLQEGTSLVMKLNGAGAPGTIGATVDVGFAENADGTTTVSYDADAVVGGMVGGVGQRMLTSVSRRMAGEFFGNVDGVLTGASPVAASGPPPRGRCRLGCGHRVAARVSSSRPPRPRPGRATTSSRASSSAPGWCSPGSSWAACSGGGGEAGIHRAPGEFLSCQGMLSPTRHEFP